MSDVEKLIGKMTKDEISDYYADIEFEISRERFLNSCQFIKEKEEKEEDEFSKKYYKKLNEDVNKRLHKLDNQFF